MTLQPNDIESLLHHKTANLFAKWVFRLRLQDWDVVWKIVRKNELPEGKSGSCSALVMKKKAKILILHPDDEDPGWLDRYDLETTIVHELVHLHLETWSLFFGEGDHALVLLEQAVHAFTAALIAADRSDPKWTNFPEMISVQDRDSVIR